MDGESDVHVEVLNQFDYDPIDSSTFFATTHTSTWLVENLLLDGATTVLSAPKKCLATSIALDLAISAASGTTFLGRFPVADRRKVAYITGTTRKHEVRVKARAICLAHDLDPNACDIDWQFGVPQGCDPDDLSRLAFNLKQRQVKLVIIDPLFLLLRGCSNVAAENVYQMGATLESVAEQCLEAGATPVFVHHAVKQAGSPSSRPLSLEEMAFSGIGEVARQWVLLNRAASFNVATKRHDLHMSVGTSSGHATDWRVSVDEGSTATLPTTSGWRVHVAPHRAVSAYREPEYAGGVLSGIDSEG